MQSYELLVADADATQAIIARVLGAVADLPDHERAVVQLFYFDGYSIRAVAQALKLPVTTIKKRLQYARDRLRWHLMDHFKRGGMTILVDRLHHQVKLLYVCRKSLQREPYGIFMSTDRVGSYALAS